MRISKLIFGMLALTGSLTVNALSQSYSPNKVFGRYQQFVWQEQHGLPQNTVIAATRSRDGYLWFGTIDGAARFDGVRFTVFESSNTSAIQGNRVFSLLEDGFSNLWMTTVTGGLTRRSADGRFTHFSTHDGLSDDHTTYLLEDRAGNVWIGTDGGGVNVYRPQNDREGRFTSYGVKEGLPDAHVWTLAEDRDGAIWIGTLDGLARFKDDRFTIYTTRDGLGSNEVRSLCLDRAGDLWVGTAGGGLARFKDGGFTRYGVKDGLRHDTIWKLFEDREDTLWVGTYGGGLYRFKDGRFDSYAMQDGLPGNRVVMIYQDPEGDLWVGTEGGLSQLKDARFKSFTAQDGMAGDFTRPVYEDRQGALWFGGQEGVTRYQHGTFTTWTKKDGLPNKDIDAIGEDGDGSLWFGTRTGGLSQFKNGRFRAWTTSDGLPSTKIFSIRGDRAGNLWIATFGDGLIRFRDGRFTSYTQADGLVGNDLTSLYEDRTGSLWIGSRSSGISRWQNGGFTSWATKDGLGTRNVESFYMDQRGTLWIGTRGDGLYRFKDGKFVTITRKDGLHDDTAYQILSDAQNDTGDLWLSSNRGIYRVSLPELNEFADGRRRSVTSFSYGVADGMLSRECNGGQPAGSRTRDGRLWFPTLRGVVALDPQPYNSQASHAVIEGATLAGAAAPLDKPLRIEPGQENLEIQYTALNWSRPQQIRFKYQMAGLHPDWIEAGTRRTAYFSYLPPGDYTFKVIADNGEGVWNSEGQSLRITVLPPFYRTWWFRTLALLILGGLIFAAFQYRVRQLDRARVAQERFSRQLLASQEHERQRIASELHDSLGQSLLIIKNRVWMALSGIADQKATAEQLTEISESAARAIEEARAISYNLRPFQLERFGLTKTLQAIVQQASKTSGIRFEIEIDEIDGLLSKDGQINLYRIVQEILSNIIKHSRATEARLTIRRDEAVLRLLAQDNGQGIVDADRYSPQTPAQAGGFGLIGMAERARILGGSFACNSTPGAGMTISITLPVSYER